MRQYGLIEVVRVVYRDFKLLGRSREFGYPYGDVMPNPNIQIQRRFSSLLSGKRKSAELWDTILAESNEFVVVPTKGSIVPFWVLLVPKTFFLNFAQLGRNEMHSPYEMVASIAGHFKASSFLWFEHGASMIGSATGCGVDHAHIHILLRPSFSLSDMHAEAVLSSNVDWAEVLPHDAYNQIESNQDYYVCGDGTSTLVAQGKSLGRQFFRKVIANLANIPEEWDYQRFYHLPNVVKTIDALEARQLNAA